jgi:hypothetical protein
MKNMVGILMGTALNLQPFYNIKITVLIFTIFMLLFHEHGRPFHRLASYSVSSFSVFSFYCSSLSAPWLGLFLGIFLRLLIEFFSQFFLSMSNYWYIEKLLIFICWFCILLLWLKCLSDLRVFWRSL